MIGSRNGFGTLGIVLVVLGLCMVVVLGASRMSQGSRISIGRLVTGARALDAGVQAIEEVCELDLHKQAFITAMIAALPASSAYGPIPPQRRIGAFLARLDPTGGVDLYKPGGPNEIAPGIHLLDLPGNTVGFGVGPGLERTAAAVVAAHAEEASGATAIQIGPVKVRPLLYMMTRTNSSGGRRGRGAFRAMVAVKYAGGGERTGTRTVIEDREFDLVPTNDDSTEWDIAVASAPRGRQVYDDF